AAAGAALAARRAGDGARGAAAGGDGGRRAARRARGPEAVASRGGRAAGAPASARGPPAASRRGARRPRGWDRRGRGRGLRLALVALHGPDAGRDQVGPQAEAVTKISLPRVEEPLVSVVMVLYGGWELAVRSISALAANTDPCFELVLVDNASPDDSLGQ